MSDLLHRFLFPDVDRHLLTDDGEYVIDEVEKHWIVTVVPVLALVASVLCFLSMWQLGHWWIIGLVVGLVCQGWAVRELYLAHMDRFVITNMRVFRVHGIADKHMATMPMSRIRSTGVSAALRRASFARFGIAAKRIPSIAKTRPSAAMKRFHAATGKAPPVAWAWPLP